MGHTGTDRASGKPASLSGCEVLTLNDDGLIVTQHVYYDVETILEQTGPYKGQKLAPPPLPIPTGPVEMHVAKNDAIEQTNAASLGTMNDDMEIPEKDWAFFRYLDDGISSTSIKPRASSPSRTSPSRRAGTR